jgi:hypothetical protein
VQVEPATQCHATSACNENPRAVKLLLGGGDCRGSGGGDGQAGADDRERRRGGYRRVRAVGHSNTAPNSVEYGIYGKVRVVTTLRG